MGDALAEALLRQEKRKAYKREFEKRLNQEVPSPAWPHSRFKLDAPQAQKDFTTKVRSVSSKSVVKAGSRWFGW